MTKECPKCHTKNPEDSKFCKECATPLSEIEGISISQTRTLQTPSEGLTRGTLFADRYEIIEKLGEGGMGTVYRVEDTKVGEEVALKLINPLVSSDTKTIERFRNELKFARKIRHRNVCQMFDLGEDEGTHFITMEFVAGEDLKSLLRRTGKLTVEMAVRVAKQVAEGLAEAHRLGIVHRDLKPSNIMIDKEGHARIMDFGIARSKEASGITGAGLVIGTPEYMSPEQAEGKKADSRSDIYSLGVILFEVLTGERPFEGDSALGVAMKHKGEEPREPRLLNPNISESINELVLKCLKKNPSDRYQNTEELLTELTSLDLKLPDIKTREKHKSGLISKEITVSFSLRKFLVPVVVLIMVIAAGLFIWRPWAPKTVSVAPTGKPSLAIVYFRNITGDSKIDSWQTKFPEYLMADLDLSKYINVLDHIKIYSTLKELDLLEADVYSENDLKNICEIGQSSHILTGLILRSGSNYQVNITLRKADTLESLGSDVAEGSAEVEMEALVDQLTPKVKNLLGFTDTQISNDIDLAIGNIRPKSDEAYELDIRATRAADIDQDYELAIELSNKVLEIEPDYGRAWIGLSVFYSNVGKSREAMNCIKKALEHQGRMSVKDANWAKAILYSKQEKTWDLTLQAFQDILRDYPDHLEANADSGFYNFAMEEYDEAIKYTSNLFGRNVTHVPYTYLAKGYSAKGLYEKAAECLRYYLENVREEEEVYSQLALVYLCQANQNKALLEIEKSPKSDPNLSHLYAFGRILYCQEDFNGAETAFKDLKQSQFNWYQCDSYKNLHNIEIAQGRFKVGRSILESGMEFVEENNISDFGSELHLALFYNYIKAGQAEAALNIYEKSMKKIPEVGFFTEMARRQLMYLRGVALLGIGELEEAQSVAASLKNLIESGLNKKAIRLYYHLSGLIEERKGNFERALELYSDALELAPYEHDPEAYLRLDRAPYLESMGLVYFKMRELDKAIEQFEKIQSLTLGRLDYGDIYAKSYYTMGKIFEKKGWEGKAIENYEKFLSLWKEADPGIAEVEDARKSLADLKS